MPKEFYTEKDIEDLVRRGVLSLNLNENVVLTELAYEKANRLGLQLVRNRPETPPSAPVRPSISQQAAPVGSAPVKGLEKDLSTRIRSAVAARMGNQVDPALLDVIIERVLKSTGMK